VDVGWLLACGVASSVWCVAAAAQLGPTFDEPFYLNAGLTSWRTGSNKLLMTSGTMPMPVECQALPIYLWEQARGTDFHPYQDIATILPVARAANLVFWYLLLVYAMRLGRTWGGAWGGRVAVGLLAADPNFLGHAALATTDISVVACLLALIYHFHHGQGCGWGRRVVVPGICYGLATLAKASGMVFGAQALLVMGLYYLVRAGALTPPPGVPLREKIAHVWHAGYALRRDLVAIAAIGFALVFAYTGSDWGVEPTFVSWADGLPDGGLKTAMVPLSRELTVFPNAGEALVQQIKHNMRGHGTYLLGEWHPRAYWAYFPIALTMKTPIPALLLIASTLLLRRRDWNAPLGWVALVLLLFSLNCRVQIGVRFMFTLMAVAYIAAAVAVARGWAKKPNPPTPFPKREGGAGIDRRAAGSSSDSPFLPREGGGGVRLPFVIVAGLLAASAATAAWVWPHGVGYFNPLWGGPGEGYTRLHDSNYDWGQGLPELKAWHAAHGDGRPLAVWYYGTDPAILFPPFRITHFSFLPVKSGDDVRAQVGPGFLAVSVGALYGDSDITPSSKAAVAWLRTQRPVARTHTFFVYDFR